MASSRNTRDVPWRSAVYLFLGLTCVRRAQSFGGGYHGTVPIFPDLKAERAAKAAREAEARAKIKPPVWAPPAVISVEGLTKVYGGGNPFFPGEGVKALNNITAQVSGPGAAALVGEACAGKTTLLKCIAGCEDPTAGTIKVSGMRKAVYVGGDLRSTSMRTVKDLLRKAVQEYHWDKKPSAMDETTDNILEAVDLNKQCNTRARDLSGGEVHRFALGMALAKGSAAPTPPVLLLDGIFYHLDSRIRVGVGRCIRDLEKRLGVMVIFTTFQEDCVREMATQVVDMQHGQIRQIAPLSESRYKTAADIHRMMNIEQERRQRQRDDELKAMHGDNFWWFLMPHSTHSRDKEPHNPNSRRPTKTT